VAISRLDGYIYGYYCTSTSTSAGTRLCTAPRGYCHQPTISASDPGDHDIYVSSEYYARHNNNYIQHVTHTHINIFDNCFCVHYYTRIIDIISITLCVGLIVL
jgi:hypothetical protein